VIPRRLNFICRRFGTFYPVFIGGVSRKNKRDEIVGVFTREKVCLDNSLSQSEVEGTGMERVEVEKQALEGKDPKWSKYGQEKRRSVGVRKGGHENGRDQTFVFQVAVSLL
jgi:hypothetical protein